MSSTLSSRKIIHIDMDCFYAAIEIRDNPSLADKPIAVGGRAEERSVLCTCNYIARKFGVRSAMASAYALRLCPDLIILPVDMNKYREVSQQIFSIFQEYTSLIEPLSLDEAYLDVTNSPHCQGSATWIAREIKQKIQERLNLTASAGIAPNKFLAKIASGWKKPNGLFLIRPQDIETFVKELPVEELFGVGKVTAKKMYQLNIKTCADLQKWSLPDLTYHFGKLGQRLHQQCRGEDNRNVEPDRTRKSLSVERTFIHDIQIKEDCGAILQELHERLIQRVQKYAPDRVIKNQYIKVKTNHFKLTTLERSTQEINFKQFELMLEELKMRHELSWIRLMGLGVHFVS